MTDPVTTARQDVEAFNEGDWERLRACYAQDCVYEEVATHRHIQGPDAILEANRGWKAAFPDARGTITTELASGDTVTQEVTWEGTQSGPLAMPEGEIPPSNKHVEVKAVQLIRCEGDKIKEIHHYFDMLDMLEQIGATPAGEPAQAG